MLSVVDDAHLHSSGVSLDVIVFGDTYAPPRGMGGSTSVSWKRLGIHVVSLRPPRRNVRVASKPIIGILFRNAGFS